MSPLAKGKSRKVISQNIRTMNREGTVRGKPLKPGQSIAIALRLAGKLYDLGVSFCAHLRASRNLRARMQSNAPTQA